MFSASLKNRPVADFIYLFTMIRKSLKEKEGPMHNGFRLRGLENTRIESLSDGVFAIAIGLLLISSSVPETYAELKLFMADFLPFATTITLLILIWKEHYIFFIRYGLKDGFTLFLNSVLLFLLLFYVYPLKFLFKVLFRMFADLITHDREDLHLLFTEVMPMNEAANLMTVYGLGAAAIFATIGLMYHYAYRRRQRLELNELEIFDTKLSLYGNLIMASIPLISAIMAFSNIAGTGTFTLSGMFYMTYGVIMPVYYYKMGKKREKVVKSIEEN